MLTKRDLELISVLMDSKLEAKLDLKLNPIHDSIREIKTDIHTLKKEIISVNNRLDKNTSDLVDLITTGFNSFEARV